VFKKIIFGGLSPEVELFSKMNWIFRGGFFAARFLLLFENSMLFFQKINFEF
jgi:hypothetical protein